MDSSRAAIRKRAAARGKYAPLHRQLLSLTGDRWRASFAEIERVLGFDLPESARLYPAWWSNGGGHSHALAWVAAGFRVRVLPEKEIALFERGGKKGGRQDLVTPSALRGFDLDREWAALPGAPWPKGFTASREQLYGDDGP